MLGPVLRLFRGTHPWLPDFHVGDIANRPSMDAAEIKPSTVWGKSPLANGGRNVQARENQKKSRPRGRYKGAG